MPKTEDSMALLRLLPFVQDAISRQPQHVADQLDAALREGRTSLRFEPSAVGVVVVAIIDGCEVAEVDIRHLVAIE